MKRFLLYKDNFQILALTQIQEELIKTRFIISAIKQMKTILILFFSLLNLIAYSQETSGFEVPNFAPKSPEAGAFLKYGEYPVDLSTGVPNISIPLYTIEEGDFKMPISLAYHASGIKVDQEATWVGLGWNLNYGAQIILSPRDDIDQNNPYVYDDPDMNALANYMNAHPYNFTSGYYSNLQFSRIRDIYNFSSPTANGTFYVKNRETQEVVIFPPDAFKVEIFNSSTQYMRFKITDISGNIYFFNHTAEKSLRTLTHNNFYFSAWYVDQIKTARNSTIDFEYEDDGINKDYSVSQRIEIHEKGIRCRCPEQTFPKTVSSVITEGGTTFTNTKKISSITFNGGHSKVTFPRTADRDDLDNANGQNSRLDRLEVRHLEGGNFVVKKGYSFSYSYFISPTYSPSDYKKKRLRLDAISTLLEGDSHEFFYSDIDMPLKTSYSKDYFGYFNGYTNLNLIPRHFLIYPFQAEVGSADKRVNPLVNQMGMLTEIHYPSKGWTKFNYESNQYFGVDKLGKYNLHTVSHNDLTGTGTGPVHENNIMIELPEGPVCGLSAIDCPIVQSEAFNLNHATGTLTYSISVASPVHYKYCRVKFYVNGVLIDSSNAAGTHTFTFNDLTGPGEIVLEVYGSGMKISDFQVRYVNNDPTPKNIYGGGLRIESIENYNHDNMLVSEKEYNYNDPINNSHSSGRLVNEQTVSFFTNTFSNVSISPCDSSCSGSCAGLWFGANYDDSYSLTSSSRYGIEGNSVVYQYVKEKNLSVPDNAKTNGFTLYKFSTDPDLIPWGDPVVQIYTSWKRGKILEKKIYKSEPAGDYLLSEETNTYFDDNSKLVYIDGFKMFRHGNVPVSENSATPLIPPSPFNIFSSECRMPADVSYVYEPSSMHLPIAWSYLKSTESKQYFYNDNNALTGTILNNKTFNYNNPVHLQLSSEVSMSSQGESVETKYYYPQDAEMSGEPNITALVNRNMVGTPLSTIRKKAGNTISEVRTKYQVHPAVPDLILPAFVYTKKGDDIANPLSQRIEYSQYDTSGNLLEYKITGGTYTALIWGYGNSQLIAKIENCQYATIPSALIAAAQTATLTGTQHDVEIALMAIRNDLALAKSMVTTYTYIPLFGVSSVTDPKGNSEYYNYDNEGRLVSKKDNEHNFLSENQYHYKN